MYVKEMLLRAPFHQQETRGPVSSTLALCTPGYFWRNRCWDGDSGVGIFGSDGIQLSGQKKDENLAESGIGNARGKKAEKLPGRG